ANDQATGQAFSTVGNAPIDSIQEFRGTVAGFDASAGRGSGGQIQLTTNSGTNQYHGNLREYYRTEKTAANSFFNNSNKVARPALRRHQYGGSFGGPLPIPHFGENDGPAFRSGKDKLFFFVDIENRRDRSQVATSRVVPLPTFLNGQLGYVLANNAQTGAACTIAARANDPATAGCIGYVTPAGLAGLDPQHVGVNSALLGLYNSRFPAPNDLTGGDGVNTGLLRFNAPNVRDDHIYTLRFDAKPTDHQTLFVRSTITRRASTNSVQFLPGDPDAVELKDQSYGWVVGHSWVISPTLTNVATVGITKSQLFFTPPDVPSFPYSFSGGTAGAPFPSLSYQDRLVTTPTIRDDVTWSHGTHTFFGGFSYKPIRQLSHLTNDFNFVAIGTGGLTANLNSAPTLRPANILNNATARSRYDSAFTTLLGRLATVSTNFNYDSSLKPLAPGSGKVRNYAYNESEYYVQDNWKIRSDLTLNLGVRYVYYPAPYETNGLLATDTVDWKALFATRVSNAAAGIAGDSAEPFLVYNLAGKTNNGPPLYATDKNNFAPRLGFAYSPSAKDGFMGTLFGDRKTSIRASWGMTYDRVSGAVLFIQNQSDYLFANSAAKNFGNSNAAIALLTDPRFTGVNTVPPAVNTIAPTITKPFTPFVDSSGSPFGEAEGQTNYDIDHNFKTPYSHLINVSYQRELGWNHLLTVSYVGRLGKSLFVQSDAAQVLNFKDPASGQFLFPAFNQLQSQLQAGGTLGSIA
ncbi:MAG TPA: TonB-dependent receptor, partial [Pyrinomonadaceae bacterium]|nr:TonB-dependent receptor [Pyrinomonadaceae bacterium]